jgi:hydroxypyruvate isomerase
MMNRRQLLRGSLLTAGALALGHAVRATGAALTPASELPFRHSACRWCYSGIPLEELCERGQDIGLQSIELLKPDEWPVALKAGLGCAVATADFIRIPDGFNDRRQHTRLQAQYPALIRQAADAGIPHVICFSGNRRGMRADKGLENCARGLEPLVRLAESAGVTLIMELLNSKVDHRDYMADHTEWGVALVNKIGSPHFRLLYDIYHMQIMEGDLIRTIQTHHTHLAHYHTGGVPGRHEINASQEINYPAVVRAIVATGYTGYLGQEFIPTYDDKLAALAEGLGICSVAS